MNVDQYADKLQRNLIYWNKKLILQKIYRNFYNSISGELVNLPELKIVEIGSGIGKIKEIIPNCILTDLFPNPWIDQVENAYKLSFDDKSISNLILFDVFHHLRYPGTALQEFNRVLGEKGQVIIFEPDLSILGLAIYGLFHPEPIAFNQPIIWFAPHNWTPDNLDYYAAQGNASRIFSSNKYKEKLSNWKILKIKKFSAISYIGSGGYSKLQIYPDCFYSLVKSLERFCNLFPILFSTRLLVVLKNRL